MSAPLDRRRFLRLGALGMAGLALPARALPANERSLRFFHTHTGESGEIVYWAAGSYSQDGLARIDHLLRDHYSGEVKRIDVALLELLHRLASELESSAPFHVISGYRSPATNAMLAARSGGVAAHSLHLEGRAIDLNLPGCALPTLREAALALRAGGVGFYPASDFVHVDVGRVRWW